MTRSKHICAASCGPLSWQLDCIGANTGDVTGITTRCDNVSPNAAERCMCPTVAALVTTTHPIERVLNMNGEEVKGCHQHHYSHHSNLHTAQSEHQSWISHAEPACAVNIVNMHLGAFCQNSGRSHPCDIHPCDMPDAFMLQH